MTVNKNNGRLARMLLSGSAVVAMTFLAAACSSAGSRDVNPSDYDFRLRHPIVLSDEPEVFHMPVGMHGPAISPEVERAVRNYVSEYRRDGTGGITIQVPTGSANDIAAARTGHALHYALVRAGVPRSNIAVAPYEVGNHAELAPLRLSYLRVKAVVPRCGIWPGNTEFDYRNSDYSNFGCAAQQNMAAMVANPADFLQPEPMSPADGRRRADVITKWRQGNDPQSNIILIESGIGG
jgi:pilus assembly protein CpaD